jgi:protein-disulfide isomerase
MKHFIQPGDQTLGNAESSLQVICYGDYLSPASREMHFTMSRLVRAFEEMLYYAFRPFPQPRKYAHSLLAARAVEAAGRQDQYWPMHYALFRHPGKLDLAALHDLACTLGLDQEHFHRDLHDPDLTLGLLARVEEGRRLGVRSAPALFVDGVLQLHPHALEQNLGGGRIPQRRVSIIGTVDPLLGTVYWGQWPGL